jgi:hypothetical protein
MNLDDPTTPPIDGSTRSIDPADARKPLDGGESGDVNGAVGWDQHDGWGLIDIEASLEWLEVLYCPNC